MTDDELMERLREVPGRELNGGLRARIRDVERAGARVTVFEVLADGTLLVVAHQAPRPSADAVRSAFERHLAGRPS